MEIDRQVGSGKCFVIAAPSGAGKTTLMNKLVEDMPGVFYNSISDTTRAMRSGEVDGEDYNFIEVPEFKAGISMGKYLEWAEVHGNFYGTPERSLVDAVENGEYPLMILDVQGYFQLKEKLSQDKICGIFILPPNKEELVRRINVRGNIAEKDLETRLKNSDKECAVSDEFEYRLKNNDLDVAYSELKSIVEKEIGL